MNVQDILFRILAIHKSLVICKSVSEICTLAICALTILRFISNYKYSSIVTRAVSLLKQKRLRESR